MKEARKVLEQGLGHLKSPSNVRDFSFWFSV